MFCERRYLLPRQHDASHSEAATTKPRLAAFQIKSDLCVDAVVRDFAVVYFSGEFLDINRANVPQRLRGFLHRALEFGRAYLGMRSCYDERNSAQHSNGGEHVTHGDWFTEQQYSAGGSQHRNAELHSGGTGSFQPR